MACKCLRCQGGEYDQQDGISIVPNLHVLGITNAEIS